MIAYVMPLAVLGLLAAACAHGAARPWGAPGLKEIAISSARFAVPEDDWEANNQVAGLAAKAALSFGLDGDGGGAGMFDRRTKIFIHALAGRTGQPQKEPWPPRSGPFG